MDFQFDFGALDSDFWESESEPESESEAQNDSRETFCSDHLTYICEPSSQ